MREPEYQFISTDPEALTAQAAAEYEKLTGLPLRPGSPEKLFLQLIVNILVQERVLTNYTGNQNIPSRAEGKDLDALGELFYARERPRAKAAVCTQRFTISEPQESAVLVPKGTRVAGPEGLVWETIEDGYIPIGETFADVALRCQTPGNGGNGYAPGQLKTLVDLYDYYAGTENITQSAGGTDEATDEEFYELMRQSMDAFSCAGARGGYEYFAKQVSTDIRDVIANSPMPGVVKLYVLMADGTLAGEEIKAAVLAACSADKVRPLTDQVFVEDAEAVEYEIDFTYYTQPDTEKSAVEIREAVEKAVRDYTEWQAAKLGRDINPSVLVGWLMQTGIKRVELRKPDFAVLRDDGKTAPQIAKLAAKAEIVNGGYEDE